MEVTGNDGKITVKILVQNTGILKPLLKKRMRKISFFFCNLAWLEMGEEMKKRNEQFDLGQEITDEESKTFMKYALWAAVKADRSFKGKRIPWTPGNVGEWIEDMPQRILNDIAITLTESRIGGVKITELNEVKMQRSKELQDLVVTEAEEDKKKVE